MALPFALGAVSGLVGSLVCIFSIKRGKPAHG